MKGDKLNLLKIQPNSRQIPSSAVYTSDKKYTDLLYGIMQEMSYIGEDGIRYVKKSDVSYVKLGQRLNLTRQTTSIKFKHLLEIGLIIYDEVNSRYQLCSVDKTLCSLVPFETLRMLNNTMNQNTISIYVYLLKRYIACGEKPYQILISHLKAFIGIATSTTSNNEIVTDILRVLNSIGLIDVKVRKDEANKDCIVIATVRNVLPT